MSLLRSIVVDDEPLARELVEGYVNQTPFLESAGSYPDALSAMEAIRNGMQAELLFLVSRCRISADWNSRVCCRRR